MTPTALLPPPFRDRKVPPSTLLLSLLLAMLSLLPDPLPRDGSAVRDPASAAPGAATPPDAPRRSGEAPSPLPAQPAGGSARPLLFTEGAPSPRWRLINDTVMGGVSRSVAGFDEAGSFVFAGTLSLENNGGFASVRTEPYPFALEGLEAVRFRVRGDGRTYQFRFRLDDGWDGVAWAAEFATVAGEWSEVELPVGAFAPTFRGRVVQGAAPFDGRRVRQLAFMLADKRPGEFRLEVARVEALVRAGTASAPGG